MEEIDESSIIKDYADNGLDIYGICEKYHIGKIRLKEILNKHNIAVRKRGGRTIDKSDFKLSDYKVKKYVEHEGFHYEAIDRNTKYRTNDYLNRGGFLTTYIEKQYGIETPTLYDRRKYYMKTGNYWWEQWFDIVEVKDKDKKKCPYCDWETVDVDNKSGAFEMHLLKNHGISKIDYLKEHKEDLPYFQLANKTENRQFETDKNKYVTCKICGKKLTRISTEHLCKHVITKEEYIEKYGASGLTSNELHKKLSNNAVETNKKMNKSFSSSQENEIKEYIRSLGFDCEMDRKILNGKELDILVKDKNFAIEFNGNIWHCERFGKDKDYHINKLNECNNKGIGLIQIFEDEYEEHKNIVLSKIKHILRAEDDDSLKIGGRKCTVKKINKRDAEKFINENNIQGFLKSSVYIGAFYNNCLIAVMSFKKKCSIDGAWELSRFATLNGTVCQGVASKMFSYFLKKYNANEVVSFADKRWTISSVDNLYTKIGFEYKGDVEPDYTCYNSKIDRYKRFDKKYCKNKKVNYDKIYDCGLFKYIWRKQ